jgi:hypothetical protein
VDIVVAQVVPSIPSGNSGFPFPDTLLQSRQGVLPQSSSMTRTPEGEVVQRSASTGSDDVAERTLHALDSFKHDLQPRETVPTTLQPEPSPLIPESYESAVPVPENMSREHREGYVANASLVSDPVEDQNSAGASLIGSQATEAISQVNVASLSKLSKQKAQGKTTDNAANDFANPISVSSASLVDSMQPHGTALAMTSTTHIADLVSSDSKHESAITATDTFQRLDSSDAPTTLVRTGARQLVVGVHDPLLGWLQVQTQSSAGHINATVTAGSAEAHASLAAQAPAIVQYLADRDVSVHSLNVHVQADQQGGARGGGQSQSGAGNRHQEMQEQRGVGVAEIGLSPFSETSNGNMPTTETASHISIHA